MVIDIALFISLIEDTLLFVVLNRDLEREREKRREKSQLARLLERDRRFTTIEIIIMYFISGIINILFHVIF